MPMRMLLTGAAGFLGSHALRHFLTKTDLDIVCPVSFAHKGLPERLTTAVDNDAWWSRVTVVKCDLSAPINDTTASLFGDIDFIVNYASQSHVERSITDPVPFIKNNVDLVLNLLEYARVVKPKAFLQINTDEVYGPAPVGYAHKEWDSTIPSNPYASSKACQDAIVTSYWRTYGIPLISTHAMNLIGETQDPEKFVPMVIGKVLRSETVSIHASADGKIGSRFYLHARNMADAVLFLLNRGNISMYADGADRPDKYHIVGEREVDNLEMAQLIAKFLNKELKYSLVDFHSSRPGHDLRYALDGKKLADLGWTMPVPFEESLRTLIEWTLAHPMWANRPTA